MIRCEYFVLCTNDAVGYIDNPVIGPVPSCKRCGDQVGADVQPFPCECLGSRPEDPCGHGDTSEGCPRHDPSDLPVAEWLAEARR